MRLTGCRSVRASLCRVKDYRVDRCQDGARVVQGQEKRALYGPRPSSIVDTTVTLSNVPRSKESPPCLNSPKRSEGASASEETWCYLGCLGRMRAPFRSVSPTKVPWLLHGARRAGFLGAETAQAKLVAAWRGRELPEKLEVWKPGSCSCRGR